jgi:2-isopropylmalate synthase
MANGSDPDVVRIFDTTLRDGEQAPGIALTRAEKVEIAEQLARLEVDVIEAGFPVSSEGEFEAVSEIASSVKGPGDRGARPRRARRHRSGGEALGGAERWRIHTFISTSDIHMTDMLRMSNGQVLDAIREGVKLAVGFTEDVEFSAQDATRTELDFLSSVSASPVDAGATDDQRARHGRLRDAPRVRRAGPDGARGGPRPRRDLDALPQRPRARRGELAGRDRERARGRSRWP